VCVLGVVCIVDEGELVRSPPPPLIDTRRGGYMYGEISEVAVFSPNRGRIVSGCCREYTMEHGVGRDSRPGKPFSRAGIASASRGSSRWRSVFCGEYCPPRLTWRSAEGPVVGDLALVKVRTTSEGYIHACRGSCR